MNDQTKKVVAHSWKVEGKKELGNLEKRSNDFKLVMFMKEDGKIL